jgi:hypothetical protein
LVWVPSGRFEDFCIMGWGGLPLELDGKIGSIGCAEVKVVTRVGPRAKMVRMETIIGLGEGGWVLDIFK